MVPTFHESQKSQKDQHNFSTTENQPIRLDLKALWATFKSELEIEIGTNLYRLWISRLNLVSFEKRIDPFSFQEILELKVSTPSEFALERIRAQFLPTLQSCANQTFNSLVHFEFVIVHEGGDVDTDQKTDSADQYQNRVLSSVLKSESGEITENAGPIHGTGNFRTNIQTAASIKLSSSLFETLKPDPRFTFDNYVVGSSNNFAAASARGVSAEPGKQFNPLFIYSPPGLGKTHLLHAIGNDIQRRFPKMKVAYFSAETFVNEFVMCLQHGKTHEFRVKFRESFDVLLIDDIQFFANKKSSEEEFFHTFERLHGSRRQIVITSDRPPKELKGIEDRIRTRFTCGLIVDIQPPEIETRIAILRTKAEKEDIYLPDNVATYIANHVKSNVRELEGILTKLQMQASITGAEITLELTKQLFQSDAAETEEAVTIESINHAICKHFGLRLADLKSSSRAKTIALPRQISMYLIRKYMGVGYKEIGEFFGGKDHSTVFHGLKKIESEIEKNDEIRAHVEAVQDLL